MWISWCKSLLIFWVLIEWSVCHARLCSSDAYINLTDGTLCIYKFKTTNMNPNTTDGKTGYKLKPVDTWNLWLARNYCIFNVHQPGWKLACCEFVNNDPHVCKPLSWSKMSSLLCKKMRGCIKLLKFT
jgi:hypothetical protein